MRADADTCVVVVFGVTGSGKSRIGAALAKSLRWTFYDADDFHEQKNRGKLRRGIPLTDRDRWPWLNRLRRVINRRLAERHLMILACSALKRIYRRHLRLRQGHLRVSQGRARVGQAPAPARKGTFHECGLAPVSVHHA